MTPTALRPPPATIPDRTRPSSAWRVDRRAAVDSTNDEVARLAEAGASAGLVLIAGEQHAGRGRRGRAWRSPPGNLYVSILLRPDRPVAEWGSLALVCGLALARALGRVAPGVDVSVKWPNDVMAGAAKIAGILLETTGRAPDGVIVGTGVNIASHPQDAERPATSLSALGVPGATPDGVLDAYLGELGTLYDRWAQVGFAGLAADWRAAACGLGRTARVNLPAASFDGLLETVDASGAAIIRMSDGRSRCISSGEIFFASAGGKRE